MGRDDLYKMDNSLTHQYVYDQNKIVATFYLSSIVEIDLVSVVLFGIMGSSNHDTSTAAVFQDAVGLRDKQTYISLLTSPVKDL